VPFKPGDKGTLAYRAKNLGLKKACDLLSQNAKIENLNSFVKPGIKGELIVEASFCALIRHTGLEILGQWTAGIHALIYSFVELILRLIQQCRSGKRCAKHFGRPDIQRQACL
jgi:hypothetical protein